MKSNLFRKVTSLGLAMAVFTGTNVFATATAPPVTVSDVAAAGTTVTSAGTVNAPIYKVKIPTAITLMLDPFEIDRTALPTVNQRSLIKVLANGGKGYAIVNHSNVDVEVGVEATAVLATNVYPVPFDDINTKSMVSGTFVSVGALDSVALAGTKDPNNTDKEVSLYLSMATDAVLSGTTTDISVATYAAAGLKELNVAKIGKTPVSAKIFLEKGKFTGDKADNQNNAKGFTAFTFQGDINTYAPWVAGDVKVAMKYSFKGLSPSESFALSAGGVIATAMRVETGKYVSTDNLTVKPETPSMGSLQFYYAKAANTAGTTMTSLSTNDPTASFTVGKGYREFTIGGTTGTYTAKLVKDTLTIPLTIGASSAPNPSTLNVNIVETPAGSIAVKLMHGTLQKALGSQPTADGYKLIITGKNGRTMTGTVNIRD